MSVKKCYLVPLDMVGNPILNFVIENREVLPTDHWKGRLVYDITDNAIKLSNGNQWITIADEGKILDIIKSDEKIIASALNDLDTRLNKIIIPTKVSELENDSNYQTLDQVNTAITESEQKLVETIVSNASDNYSTLSKIESKIVTMEDEIVGTIDEYKTATSEAITLINEELDKKADYDKIIKIIEDDEEVISAALNDLDIRLKSITSPKNVSDLKNDLEYQTLDQVNTLIDQSEVKVKEDIINDLNDRLKSLVDSLEPYVAIIDDPEKASYSILAEEHKKGKYPTVMLIGASGNVIVCTTNINSAGDVTVEWQLEDDYPINIIIKR